MPQAWQTLEFGSIQKDSLEARAAAAESSPWFDGHFPGRPILPGIAMIAMAFEAARQQEARAGNRIRLRAVKRVRFKRPVLPDDQIIIKLECEQRADGRAYRFTSMVGGEACCTGSLHIEPLSAKDVHTITAGYMKEE